MKLNKSIMLFISPKGFLGNFLGDRVQFLNSFFV